MVSRLLGEAESAALVGDWVRVEERCTAVLALQPGQEDAAELLAAALRAKAVPLVPDRSIVREPLDARSSVPALPRRGGHRWGVWAGGMAVVALALAGLGAWMVAGEAGSWAKDLPVLGAQAQTTPAAVANGTGAPTPFGTQPIPIEPAPGSTEVIVYQAVTGPRPWVDGECPQQSAGRGLRCFADFVYQPCFSPDHNVTEVVCPELIDPNRSTTIHLRSPFSVSAVPSSPRPGFGGVWLVELEDGTLCNAPTGMAFQVLDEQGEGLILWSCGLPAGVVGHPVNGFRGLADLREGSVWTATLVSGVGLSPVPPLPHATAREAVVLRRVWK